MPEFHAEPYIYLPSVTHESALVAWGAFYFRVTSKGTWKLVDDTDLKYVHPPRKDSIGALVSIAKTEATNHCWVTGLAPDTEYTFKVFVKTDEWAQGERWDWSPRDRALIQTGARYDNRFRTHPHPKTAAASPMTAKDRIARRSKTTSTFASGSRGEEASGRASHGPGLFYRFRYGADIELLCIDTSKEGFFKGHRLFEFPKHWTFVDASLPETPRGAMWRIPFAHHPPYSAGPLHHNTREMARLFPLFDRAGVVVMFSGHEHNFQHSQADGIDYFVTGAAGKFRDAVPNRFAEAHTQSWSHLCHFLLVRIEGDRMLVRAIGEQAATEAGLVDIARWTPGGATLSSAIAVRRQ